jgi:uncharacterized membrane protein
MNGFALALTTFLASGVEAVEALTIVLAAGLTRGWRSTLLGVLAATAVLAVLIAALGPALSAIPLSALRVVVGGLLLAFGLQWLRKAILRAGGAKALHNEEAIFERELAAAAGAGRPAGGLDWYGFTLAFKGVLLEGLEVVFIVLTFGANAHRMPLAVAGAAAAVVATVAAGAALHRPLARVPENTTKFVVGLMLTTFGTFWAGEGVGLHWPGSDAALPVLLAFFAASAAVAVLVTRRTAVPRPQTAPLRAAA